MQKTSIFRLPLLTWTHTPDAQARLARTAPLRHILQGLLRVLIEADCTAFFESAPVLSSTVPIRILHDVSKNISHSRAST